MSGVGSIHFSSYSVITIHFYNSGTHVLSFTFNGSYTIMQRDQEMSQND